MDALFIEFLSSVGVTDESISVLEKEAILSKSVYFSLKREHFERLLPFLKVGQHALILSIWERNQRHTRSVSLSMSESDDSRDFASSRSRSCSPVRSGASAGQKLLTKKHSIKELADMYKKSAIERVSKSRPEMTLPATTNQSITIWLGGMVYDSSKKRGVRRRYLPEPNPLKVIMKRESTFVDVSQRAIELYFSDHNIDIADVMLADSAGCKIYVAEGWRLGSFYQENNIVPSRYKLYIMVDEFKLWPVTKTEKEKPIKLECDVTVDEFKPVAKTEKEKPIKLECDDGAVEDFQLINPKQDSERKEPMMGKLDSPVVDELSDDLFIHLCNVESLDHLPDRFLDDPASEFHRKLKTGETFIDINLDVYHWYLWRRKNDLPLPEKLGHFYVINREMSGCFASFKDADHVVPPGMSDDFVLLPDKLILRQFLNEKDIRISFATKYDIKFIIFWKGHIDELCDYFAK